MRSFGRVWSVAGTLLLVAAALLAALGEYTGTEVIAIVLVFGFSTAAALGGLLLARRTGPDILYWRILSLAPELPAGTPVETSRETARRVLWPALLVALTLTAVAPFLVGAVLLIAGEPRDEALRGLPALGPPTGGAWTLVCGVAGLRMADYFERWERRYGKHALCLPLRAGLMAHVYRVIPDDPRGGTPPVG